jgi:hypothetical protein
MSLNKASYTDLLPIVLLWKQLLHYSGRVTIPRGKEDNLSERKSNGDQRSFHTCCVLCHIRNEIIGTSTGPLVLLKPKTRFLAYHESNVVLRGIMQARGSPSYCIQLEA